MYKKNSSPSFVEFIKTPAFILLCAEPESGKSYLIKYLMYKLSRNFEYGIVFSSTDDLNKDYSYIQPNYIYNNYNEEYLKNFLRLQRKLKKPAFLILDDCVGSINMNSKLLKHLFTTYRHYNLTLFVSTQYIYAVPPTLRSCANYAFIFFVEDDRTITALHKTYFNEMDHDNVVKFISQATAPHSLNDKGKFILVRKKVPREEKYIISRAPPKIQNFKLVF